MLSQTFKVWNGLLISPQILYLMNIITYPCQIYLDQGVVKLKTPSLQWNDCLCTLWLYSQYSLDLFVCIPNLGETTIWVCLSLQEKKWLCYSQDNRLLLPKLVRHKIPKMTSGSHIFISTVVKVSSKLRAEQNGQQFADNIFSCIFLSENFYISFQISLRLFQRISIDHKSSLHLVMAWCHQAARLSK